MIYYNLMIQKQYIWQSMAWTGLEILQIRKTKELTVKSIIVGKSGENTPFAIAYTITLTNNWHVKSVVITSILEKKKVRLNHREDKWYDGAGSHLSAFDGIEYIDITLSPFTNTLPIRRLSFAADKRCKIDVIYIDLPNFSLRKVQQYYSKLSDHIYRYQDVEIADFVADITVDTNLLVVDYPGLFKRI